MLIKGASPNYPRESDRIQNVQGVMMRVATGLLLWFGVVVASTTAWAGDWSATFEEEGLPEELVQARTVVATGGPGSAEVGQALVDALNEAGAPGSMLNPVFHDIEGRSDRDVVDEVGHLPVDLVVLIRTFEVVSTEGESAESDEEDEQEEPAEKIAESGMLTIYTMEGEAVAGFMVYPGRPLTREQRRRVGRGISQEALDATSEARQRDHRERYRLVQVRGRGLRSVSFALYDRLTRRTIRGDEIYRHLGRPDLAEKYRIAERRNQRNRRMGGWGMVVGIAGVGVGGAFLVSSHEFEGGNSNFDQRQVRWGVITGLGGLLVTLVSLGIWRRGMITNPHPVSRREVNRLTNEVNEKFEERQREAADEEAGLDFRISPFLDVAHDRRAGLALQIRW